MASAAMMLIWASLIGLASAASPISKVMTLLTNLEAKIKEEGDAAEIAFHEKSSWCEDQGISLEHAMGLETSKLQALLANVQKDIADIEALEAKMAGKMGDLTEQEQKLKDAMEAREKERAAFLESQKSLNEVIGALTRTIGILERENQEGTESFAQLQKATSLTQVFKVMIDASLLQQKDHKALTAFIQMSGQDSDTEDSDDEESSANLKKSDNRALQLLYDLLDQAKQSLDDANSGEINSRHDFEKLKQQIMEAMGFDQEDIRKAKQGKADTEQSKAKDEADKSHYEELLASDKKAALQLKANCLKAAVDYKAESENRVAEAKAIDTAKEALAKSGGAAKLSYGDGAALLQKKAKAASLLQIRESSSNFQAVKMVRNLAHVTKSAEIARLASRIASTERFGSANGADPFQKIQGMIMDMVEKLEKEAAEEATQKAYCDKEMAQTMDKKDEKEDEAEKLQIRMDDYSSKSVGLREDLTQLQEELAEMTKAQNEADRIRSEEKTIFKKSKKDMEDGLNGVKIALKVLREYYEGSGGSDAGKGIIGLLEVVESDFSKTIAQIVSDETQAESEYNSSRKENVIVKKEKEVTVSYKQQAIADLENRLAEKTSDHDGVQTELGAILEYKKHLDDMCVAKPEAYEVRKERREKEIAGLKEALDTLSGGGDDDDESLLQYKTSAKRQRFLRH